MKIGFHIYHYFNIILEVNPSKAKSYLVYLKGDVCMTSHLS